jgi:hypothetical protein
VSIQSPLVVVINTILAVARATRSCLRPAASPSRFEDVLDSLPESHGLTSAAAETSYGREICARAGSSIMCQCPFRHPAKQRRRICWPAPVKTDEP